jgi:hypothetical protein
MAVDAIPRKVGAYIGTGSEAPRFGIADIQDFQEGTRFGVALTK